ncbi:MAG: hypothetical protein RMY36_030450 [Nostoc sp. SerVER01]|nr:hypothetical protein [Nostoc sp. DcaGUA01]
MIFSCIFVIQGVTHIWHQATLKLDRTAQGLYLQHQSFKTRRTSYLFL